MTIQDELIKFYKSGYNYHTLKFPDGFTLEGRFDMSKYLEHFHLPNDLKGKTVLDVGAANGFFSFEFARRGAKVTAIDQNSDHWREEFNELMKTDIKFHVEDINKIDELKKYDLVFCSNVIQHNSNMIGIIKKIKEITNWKAILCTQIIDNPKSNEVPFARFIGKKITKYKPPLEVFWRPNLTCFKMMAEFTGFSNVEEFPPFFIERNFTKDKSLYAVIHCYP